MAEHLLGNVYQVGGGSITHELDGASYLLIDPDNKQHTMVDCGSTLGFNELTKELNQLDIEIGRIAVIYATHGHFDHIAGATYFPHSPLYIHENGIYEVSQADSEKTATFLYEGQSFPNISCVQPMEEGVEVAIGKSVLSFTHAPGHAPDCVYGKIKTPEGVLLIAGDILWGGYSNRMGSDYDQWTDSLDVLAKDNFDFVTFGHGASRLIPNAMNHIDYARSVFLKDIQPQNNGLLDDPWAAVWHSSSHSLIT